MGDFNVHHLFWGSEILGSGGNKLFNHINEINCNILNLDNPTHINSIPPFKKSVPDVAFCSLDLMDDIMWSISEDSYSRDHFPIYF